MDVERTMQFIIEHQASHAAAIVRLDEMFKEQHEVNRQLQAQIQTLLETALVGLRDAEQTRLGLEEAGRRDDALREDLNALMIKIADGLVRDRNGKTGSGGSNAPAV
jgi:hypothetical protein